MTGEKKNESPQEKRRKSGQQGKSVRGKGHRSGDGACELTDHNKYFLVKLQFLERHIVFVPNQQTCSLKPVSTTTVLVAARGLAHSIATDAVLPLLVTQRSSSSLGSGCNKDVEEKVLAGSVEQITPLSTERSSKKSRDTEYIMNLLKVGNEQTKQTLKKIDSTLSAYTPDVKRS